MTILVTLLFVLLLECCWRESVAQSAANNSSKNQPNDVPAVYLVETRHALFKKLFGEEDTRVLSTIPMCFTEPIGISSDGTSNNLNNSIKSSGKVNENSYPPMKVTMNWQIMQLASLNEKTQTLSMIISMTKFWLDCRMKWNKDEYQVSMLEVTPYIFKKLNVFAPGVRLLEAVNPKESADSVIDVGFHHEGKVHVIEEFLSQISCAINVDMYPFDIQSCYLTFESIYNGRFVEMSYKMNDVHKEANYLLGRYTPNDQWSLTVLPPISTQRQICSSPGRACVNDNLKFRLILRRNPDYQLLNLFFPVFLIVVISSCVFLIPPGGGDKMGLSVSLLLSLYMFSQLMYDKMPESNSVPLLSKYFLDCIMLVTASCVYSAFSAVLAYAYPHPPAFVSKFVAFVGPFLIFDLLKKTKINLTITEVVHETVKNQATQNAEEQDNNQDDCASYNQDDEKRSFNGIRLDAPDTLTWAAFGALLDRVFFVAHLVATVLVMETYLTHGYIPWTGYSALKLNDSDKTHVCAQLAIQKMPADDLPCNELLATVE